MAIPIIQNWKNYFTDPDEGLGSSYERIVLNNKLLNICKIFGVKNILEAPSFGFTGISGINSLELAKNGCNITMLDHDKERVAEIKKLWSKIKHAAKIEYLPNYEKLPFENDSFDLSWNFSALWFTSDLEKFLAELSRVTKGVIFLSVPNISGLGYLSQKLLGKNDLKKYLKEENILPQNIKKIMYKLDWLLIDSNYIDCPPWPDIGMSKEKFLELFGLGSLLNQKQKQQISILDYYLGKQPEFPKQMMKYYWFEKFLPGFLKFFWAHHKYFLFIPKNNPVKKKII